MPYHWNRHQEDPYVGDQVGDVREVGKRNNSQTGTLHGTVPICSQRPADQEQCDGDTNSPSDDEGRGCQNHFAKYGVHEDSPVEG